MLDWLVIGGGPHGVHAAVRLIGDAGVPSDAIRIVDDEERLLARWRRSTGNTGMAYLRSPGVHHIGLSSASLHDFAGRRCKRMRMPFTRPYARPALELFDRHCDDVVESHELQALHVRGRVDRLDLTANGVKVGFVDPAERGGAGELEARRVILAIGAPREPAWPDWARRAVEAARLPGEVASPDRIRHVFDPGFELSDDTDDSRVVVVGAGISGAQVALRLASEERHVVLVSRHGLRVEQFDSDPGWQGPRNMVGFSRLDDPNERRRWIQKARHRGSMPPEVHRALRSAVADGTIEVVEGAEVESATLSECEAVLEFDGRTIRADRVLLATGFPARRPGGAWLDRAVEAFELPCAACGYPIVDERLRWHPRVLVTGALAELELGPVSRNLSGAQRAGDRLLAVARQEQEPASRAVGRDCTRSRKAQRRRCRA